METNERDQIIFNLAYSFLKEKLLQKKINSEILNKYLAPTKLESIPQFYKRLLESAANRSRSEGVIIKPIGGIDKLNEILFNFDVRLVKENYIEPKILLDKIIKRFNLTDINQEKRGLWFIFCKSIISGAIFLEKFIENNDFIDFVNFFHQDERGRDALPLLLKQEIDGYGFTLSCDFLKESGFYWYGKPDIHIKDIFKALNLSESENESNLLKAIVRIAENCKKTPYAIDKIFWLIGSGKFYHDSKLIGNHKNEFIIYVKSKDIYN